MPLLSRVSRLLRHKVRQAFCEYSGHRAPATASHTIRTAKISLSAAATKIKLPAFIGLPSRFVVSLSLKWTRAAHLALAAATANTTKHRALCITSQFVMPSLHEFPIKVLRSSTSSFPHIFGDLLSLIDLEADSRKCQSLMPLSLSSREMGQYIKSRS